MHTALTVSVPEKWAVIYRPRRRWVSVLAVVSGLTTFYNDLTLPTPSTATGIRVFATSDF